jgi:BirA family biotin operon repressor/biotin-[acetyl-CoA-carboxylase] ligase
MTIFGKEIIHLTTVDSTNKYAAKLVSDQIHKTGTVILADSQTNGKGQRGNSWLSEPSKNLLFTLIYTPDNLSALHQSNLNWLTSISLVKTLGKFNIEAKIKWPNDILVQRKKIAGILIENQLLGENIHCSLIGIGMNVNQQNFGELVATSVYNELNQFLSREVLLHEIIDQMNEEFQKLTRLGNYDIKSEYESMLFQINETGFYEDHGGQFEGEIIGVKTNGFLLVKVNGEIREYGIKEIRFWN